MHTSLGTSEESSERAPKFSHIASITCGIQGIRQSVFLHNKIAELVLFCLNIRAFFPCGPPLMTCRIGSAVGKLPGGCQLSSVKCGCRDCKGKIVGVGKGFLNSTVGEICPQMEIKVW